jgi:hypothetical protein
MTTRHNTDINVPGLDASGVSLQMRILPRALAVLMAHIAQSPAISDHVKSTFTSILRPENVQTAMAHVRDVELNPTLTHYAIHGARALDTTANTGALASDNVFGPYDRLQEYTQTWEPTASTWSDALGNLIRAPLWHNGALNDGVGNAAVMEITTGLTIPYSIRNMSRRVVQYPGDDSLQAKFIPYNTERASTGYATHESLHEVGSASNLRASDFALILKAVPSASLDRLTRPSTMQPVERVALEASSGLDPAFIPGTDDQLTAVCVGMSERGVANDFVEGLKKTLRDGSEVPVPVDTPAVEMFLTVAHGGLYPALSVDGRAFGIDVRSLMSDFTGNPVAEMWVLIEVLNRYGGRRSMKSLQKILPFWDMSVPGMALLELDEYLTGKLTQGKSRSMTPEQMERIRRRIIAMAKSWQIRYMAGRSIFEFQRRFSNDVDDIVGFAKVHKHELLRNIRDIEGNGTFSSAMKKWASANKDAVMRWIVLNHAMLKKFPEEMKDFLPSEVYKALTYTIWKGRLEFWKDWDPAIRALVLFAAQQENAFQAMRLAKQVSGDDGLFGVPGTPDPDRSTIHIGIPSNITLIPIRAAEIADVITQTE